MHAACGKYYNAAIPALHYRSAKRICLKMTFFLTLSARTLQTQRFITLNSYFSNTYFYNRIPDYPIWDGVFTHSKSSAKAVLAYGFESRQLRTVIGRVRASVKKNLVAAMVFRQVRSGLSTQAAKFENRNFDSCHTARNQALPMCTSQTCGLRSATAIPKKRTVLIPWNVR